jgi:hypothetical protein
MFSFGYDIVRRQMIRDIMPASGREALDHR